MNRTTLRYLPRNRSFQSIVKNRLLIVLLLVYIISVFTGSLLMRSDQSVMAEYVDTLFRAFLLERTNKHFFVIMFGSLVSFVPYYLAMFFSGASLLGCVAVPITLFFRGLGTGLLTGFLYKNFEVKGVGFSALIIIPAATISVIALILAAREGIAFSLQMIKVIMPNRTVKNLSYDFKLYCYRYVFIFFILVLAALLDSALSVAFIRFFSF